MENKNDPYLMDHNYDGIKELNNPMPSWWLATFFITIVFAVIYYLHYEIAGVSNSDKELSEDLQAIETLRRAADMNNKAIPPQDLLALAKDPSFVASGAQEYKLRCASCHGERGEGLIGPNLTDNYFLHGDGKVEDIVRVISSGVIEKGMPAWNSMMSPDKINRVAVYVLSLTDTNVPNGKAPDGAKIK